MRKLDPVKHEEKRREILDAAERCFVRDGLKGASISSICAEARISPGHLYHYFTSKEAIVGAMIEARLEEAAARFAKRAEGADVLSTLFGEMKVTRSGHPALLLEALAEANRSPPMAKALQDHTKGVHSLLADLLEKGQAAGTIDPTLDRHVTASLLISIIDGSKTLYLRDPKLDVQEATRALQTMLVRYLAPASDTQKV
ncbi:TetR/AcrR family transcriptional regulator [Sphingomonas albertensis]|uniref:TetR/AcrR family transcriptional regulator n=1 Tax=Sphingomonas albertensis TaxID=2762591 RepID=A0ABR7AKX2_9SPHN|nr:TetR/AcrR family transcriptional regulator [Sphingomonas albertensis]MBC3941108.1 TetR/AcrR family transcriptional regulator [Sphingomonas albertensis]